MRATCRLPRFHVALCRKEESRPAHATPYPRHVPASVLSRTAGPFLRLRLFSARGAPPIGPLSSPPSPQARMTKAVLRSKAPEACVCGSSFIYVTCVTETALYEQNGVPARSRPGSHDACAPLVLARLAWPSRPRSSARWRHEQGCVQMGRYWEVEADHEGPVPVRAGCGASGRRERATRAGSADGRREWTARAGGASGRRVRFARSDGV